MPIQQVRRILFGVVTTVMIVFGTAPVHLVSAASDRGASAIAALDAIPAEDWLKQSSGALLDRVIAASSKESLDAAAIRDPRAQALVGSAYMAGLHGYAKSEAEAVKFYRLAANSSPIAQNNLGSLLLSGVANGGKPAPSEAAEMFRRAANLGHPVAQANLGKLYADGVGVEKDVAKAKEFLALAAAQGNTDARNFLNVLEAREAAEADAAERRRLEAAAATGDADALRELAKAYSETEKKVFDAIKNNQFQAAINALLKAPDGKKVPVAKLVDEHGMTALHWAVQNRNAAGTRWLLDKQADLELKDDQGRTPLKIALDNKDTVAMTLLIGRGAMTTTALPGHDEELKALKKTSDIVDFMIRTAAADAAKPAPRPPTPQRTTS
jgi:TPR repeat protein